MLSVVTRIIIYVLALAFLLLYDLLLISYFAHRYRLEKEDVNSVFVRLGFPLKYLLRGYQKTILVWKDESSLLGVVVSGLGFAGAPLLMAFLTLKNLNFAEGLSLELILDISFVLLILVCFIKPLLIKYTPKEKAGVDF